MNLPEFHAICFVNNSISAKLAYDVILHDKIDFSKVLLIKLRNLQIDWEVDCGLVLDYGKKPSLNFLGQITFLDFYSKASALLKKTLYSPCIREIYICNNDNLLCAHIIQSGKSISARITVLSEGIMNYQEIGLSDRAWWRWLSKPAISFLLGLRYKTPTTHLSGAYENEVQRVIAFSLPGLKAPIEKVSLFPFKPVAPLCSVESNTALIVHTGLWQWMPAENYSVFAKSFVEWIRSKKFNKIYYKNHPHIPTGELENFLTEAVDLKMNGAIEKIAQSLPAGTVIGTCCTALGTLKLLRPDLRCIDYGADYYCEYAYHGDLGVIDFLEGCGVELVNFGVVEK